MELKVKKDDYNHLLKRKEVYVEIAHENQGSPSRSALRDAVASKYGAKPENVYVIDVHTRTGTQQSLCQVQVYDDEATAKQVVPEYVRIRNLPTEERKKVREQKAKKREEKPKEAPKAPVKKEAPKEEAKEHPKEVKEGREGKEAKPKEEKEQKETKEAKGAKETKEAAPKEGTKQPSKEGHKK